MTILNILLLIWLAGTFWWGFMFYVVINDNEKLQKQIDDFSWERRLGASIALEYGIEKGTYIDLSGADIKVGEISFAKYNINKNLWEKAVADAIVEEFEIEYGSKIDHQCGSVWIGGVSLMAVKTEDDEDDSDAFPEMKLLSLDELETWENEMNEGKV